LRRRHHVNFVARRAVAIDVVVVVVSTVAIDVVVVVVISRHAVARFAGAIDVVIACRHVVVHHHR
jgi:hypothetical protein